MFLEVVAPHLAIGMNPPSPCSPRPKGRRAEGPGRRCGFDLNVPGTLELGAALARVLGARPGAGALPVIPGGMVFADRGNAAR